MCCSTNTPLSRVLEHLQPGRHGALPLLGPVGPLVLHEQTLGVRHHDTLCTRTCGSPRDSRQEKSHPRPRTGTRPSRDRSPCSTTCRTAACTRSSPISRHGVHLERQLLEARHAHRHGSRRALTLQQRRVGHEQHAHGLVHALVAAVH